VTSKPDFKVMVLLLVFMQLTRDLFAIAKFLFYNNILLNINQKTAQYQTSDFQKVVKTKFTDQRIGY